MEYKEILSHLPRLQLSQIEHDFANNKDIIQKPINKKVIIYTLHLAKYQGEMCRATKSGSEKTIGTALVDSFIVTLAMANALDINLHDEYKEDDEPASSNIDLISDYVQIVGNMAKACEAMERLEDFSSRKIFEDAVVNLLFVIARFSKLQDVDLISRSENRHKAISKNSLVNALTFSALSAANIK